MTDRLRVLIVEDEMLIAMDLGLMIANAGHDVVGKARSVREVAALPIAVQPHLALVDMHLDDNSTGVEASLLIHARWPDALIVFVTANAARIPDDYAEALGSIGKPFSSTGIKLSMKYLTEAVHRPPPPPPTPSALQLSPSMQELWCRA